MFKVVGKITVTTAGTPIQLSAQTLVQTALGSPHLKTVQAVLLQAIPSNTGLVYIGNSGLTKATYVGCGYVLGIPVAGTTAPAWGTAQNAQAAGVDLSEIYLDVGTSGEGVLCSILVS